MTGKPNIRLKILLLEQDITQRQLAWGIQIDEGLISKAVKYNMTTAEIRGRIADFLEINQEDIFDLPDGQC